MTAPIITIRDLAASHNILSSLNYFQSKIGSGALPVLQGEISVSEYFRIYNNFALASGIEDAINVSVTVYDGAGAGSHTASSPIAAQSWLHIYETGFGQSTSLTNDPLTRYTGNDTSVGGTNTYIPEKGSAGVYGTPTLSGASNLGSFIEFETYLAPPNNAVGAVSTFVISIIYEFI